MAPQNPKKEDAEAPELAPKVRTPIPRPYTQLSYGALAGQRPNRTLSPQENQQLGSRAKLWRLEQIDHRRSVEDEARMLRNVDALRAIDAGLDDLKSGIDRLSALDEFGAQLHECHEELKKFLFPPVQNNYAGTPQTQVDAGSVAPQEVGTVHKGSEPIQDKGHVK